MWFIFIVHVRDDKALGDEKECKNHAEKRKSGAKQPLRQRQSAEFVRQRGEEQTDAAAERPNPKKRNVKAREQHFAEVIDQHGKSEQHPNPRFHPFCFFRGLIFRFHAFLSAAKADIFRAARRGG